MKLDEFYQEEPGGSFTHDGVKYLLNPLFKFTESLPVITIPTSRLSWIIDPEQIEEFKYADTSIPILVVPWKNKLVVIDGFHRLLKAVDENIPYLPAKMVPLHLLHYLRVDK